MLSSRDLNFDVADYPSLSGFSISSDVTDVSSLSLGLLREITLVNGSQILNLVIGVAIDSTTNAQELLLDTQLADREINVEETMQRGDLNGITVGDLNFVPLGATTTALGGPISFVRNNVFVAISDGSPDNPSTVDRFALATAIDAIIQAEPNLSLSQFNGEKPVITLVPASNSLSGGASTAVTITVTDPTNDSGPISRQFLTEGNLTVQDNGTGLTVSPYSTTGANNLKVVANNIFLQFGISTVTFTVTQAVSAPVWSIGLTHTGTFSQGQSKLVYTIYVNNVGGNPTTGQATLTETLPAGLTLVSMSGSGWACTANTCTRNDPLASGASYSPVTVTVNVAANAPGSVSNQATISGGGASQSATDLDLTTIDSAEPVFTVEAANVGNFVFGQMNEAYTITISNMGALASSGTVTVTDTVPAGLTLTTMSGSGWSCIAPTCTRTDPLNPGGQYAAILANVNVASNAPAQVTNGVTVSGGGAPDAGATDVTTISAAPSPMLLSPSQVQTTASGLAYSRVSKTFNGTIILTNISGSAIGGPFQILFSGIQSAVTLVNATGTFSGTPYLTVPSLVSFAAGQIVTVPVEFSNPSNISINLTPQVYSGSFQ